MREKILQNKYKILWIAILSPLSIVFLIFLLINLEVFGFMPSFEHLENPETNLATELYSSNSVLLGKFFKENRTVVEFKEVSPNVLNALIATEDVRFYEHSGIDSRAMARVIVGLITGKRKGGGSTISQQLAKNLFPRKKMSKIGMVITKLKEWSTAVKLERNYTKEEILAMYLNTVDFGSQAFGINSAAKTFFNTTPDSLTLEQAATLIGVLKAPTKYSPALNKENSFRRRNTVLTQIEKYQNKLNDYHGYKQQPKTFYDSLKKIPIKLNYSVQSHKKGIGRYFREFLRLLMTKTKPERPKNVEKISQEYKKYLEDSTEWTDNPLYGWCNKNKKADGTTYNLYRDGLKIYSTVNSDMQMYAEEAVTEHLGGYLQDLFYKRQKNRKKAPFSWKLNDKQIQKILYSSMRRSERYRLLRIAKKDSTQIRKIFDKPTQMRVFSWNGDIDTIMTPWDSIRYYKYFLHTGLISMEPQTGYVRAYVGGIDYKHFRFDHATQSRRQVGSTFKPFLYSVAMEDNLSPCYKVPNSSVTFDMGKHKRPYTPAYSKSRRGGQMVTLKYGLANSLNQISAWIMKKYGPEVMVEMARRLGIKSPLDPVYSLCVGAADIKLSEMVAAYNTFSNKGIHVKPVYITRIEDKNGNIISKFTPKTFEAMSENTAYSMIQLMRGVVDRGTGTRLRYRYKLKNEIAGKTGTTNDNSDGWFIGYVPNLLTGVWVGGEERSIRFPSTADGQGASMALPIWGLYMQKVYKNKKLGISDNSFEKPENYDDDMLDCSKYRQKSDGTGNYLIPDDDDY